MGILGTGAGLPNDITLLMQIAILLLLLLGYIYKRSGKLRKHGLIMGSAVILHLITIFAVMIPSFAINFSLLREPSVGVIVTWIHVIIGATAIALGTRLVLSWRFSNEVAECRKNKKVMRPLLVLWAASLILGIAFYFIYYL